MAQDTSKRGLLLAQVDRMDTRPTNERQVLESAGKMLRKSVADRARRGISSSGKRMPPPKDGWTPYFRTGQLAGSINEWVRPIKRRRSFGVRPGAETLKQQQVLRWELVVEPMGDRLRGESDGKKRAAHRRRMQGRRAGLVLAAVFSASPPSRAALKRMLRGVGSKSGNTNKSVAAILSVAPKDPNGVKGRRAVYRVFELSRNERAQVSGFVARSIKMALVKEE